VTFEGLSDADRRGPYVVDEPDRLRAGFRGKGHRQLQRDLRLARKQLPASLDIFIGKLGGAVDRVARRFDPGMGSAHDPIFTRFRATLDELYGPHLERVMLYGSRARGDAREDSDYDVAVFLRDTDRIAELYRLADLSTAILSDGGLRGNLCFPRGDIEPR
jgi:predicted nucleotidyltransferase